MITVYGISNCDTVRKARRWLEAHGIEYRFHDFREDGLAPEAVAAWIDELGADALVNRRSTSWRALPASTRENLDRNTAIAAILEQPTLVKRPLLDTGAGLHCGFREADYERLFERHTL
ncbi:ArsC family reductase [Pseudohaliea rubra]|uniref:A glutathione-dependent thiol reductase n=1 Tax=Pseudohaliea rubra DSM 19751 TaxID=1265313 RepID=A0A095VSE4_9GAMM|nr:ArsC family reductase [Pseudohaliea rubra]KGE04008.1 a glutathione-dependent thiol reductase [Pseudohaliea rubra DSM 19751]